MRCAIRCITASPADRLATERYVINARSRPLAPKGIAHNVIPSRVRARSKWLIGGASGTLRPPVVLVHCRLDTFAQPAVDRVGYGGKQRAKLGCLTLAEVAQHEVGGVADASVVVGRAH